MAGRERIYSLVCDDEELLKIVSRKRGWNKGSENNAYNALYHYAQVIGEPVHKRLETYLNEEKIRIPWKDTKLYNDLKMFYEVRGKRGQLNYMSVFFRTLDLTVVNETIVPRKKRKAKGKKSISQKIKDDNHFNLKSLKMMDKMFYERNITDSSAKGYLSTIKKYTKFNKMQLYELIDEALAEQDAHIPLRESKLKQRLLDYRNYLMNDTSMSSKTVKTYFSKMLTVYRHFECEIPIIPMAQYKKEYVTTYSDLPTVGQLRQALEICPVDLRAVICFQCSSGSAKAEALSLRVEQFFEGVQEYHDIPYVRDESTLIRILDTLEEKLSMKELIVPTFYLERLKTKKYYYTFCSPEACVWIVKDLKMRIAHMGDVDSFLDEQLFNFTSSLLLTRYQDINDYFNWGNKGKFRFFRSHVLRKWNASNIQMTTEDIDNIQGRSKNVVHEAYIKVKPERLKKTYMEHMWRVCISEDWRHACIVLDPLSKEELGITTPEERAMEKIMALFEEKMNVPVNPDIVREGNVPVKPVVVNREPAPIAAPVVANNDYDKLLQYAPLLQQGLITKDEFDQIKASIFQGGK